MKTLPFHACLWLGMVAIAWVSPAFAASPATRPIPTRPARPELLAPGDHLRRLEQDHLPRSYLIHIPPQYDRAKPTPIVLVFHGAWMNAAMMTTFCGMNAKSDEAGFIAIYPNGTGFGDAALFFNAWGTPGKPGQDPPGPVDDVEFTAKMLDDLKTVVNVDAKRVFATGMSNGAMMCQRLGAELSDRIAAIAPVAGTMAMPMAKEGLHPKRPVAVLCFHGTADTIVPFRGPPAQTPKFLRFQSVEQTIGLWVGLNGCDAKPQVTELPEIVADGTRVTRKIYGAGKNGADVVLYEIEGGGHTWPGQAPPVKFIGKSTKNIVANDLIWEFFSQHQIR